MRRRHFSSACLIQRGACFQHLADGVIKRGAPVHRGGACFTDLENEIQNTQRGIRSELQHRGRGKMLDPKAGKRIGHARRSPRAAFDPLFIVFSALDGLVFDAVRLVCIVTQTALAVGLVLGKVA